MQSAIQPKTVLYYLIKISIVLTLLLASLKNSAQTNNEVEVKGYLIDKETGQKLSDVLIVNEKTRELVDVSANGDFNLKINSKTVLIFSAQGYASMVFSLKDSVKKSSYFITPSLDRYKILIAPVVVTAERELQQISDALKLENEASKYLDKEGLAPVNNPVSYFYSRYNKREKSKRKINQLKNESRKRILLKELMTKYTRYDDSIEMTLGELDDFIYRLDVSYNSLNYENHYTLLTSLKQAYFHWKEANQINSTTR